MVNVKSYVRIAEDKTEAWLYLCAPEDDSTSYEKSEIMKPLEENIDHTIEDKSTQRNLPNRTPLLRNGC